MDTLLCLPRPARIGVAALLALAVTLALSPVIDALYLRFFFDDATRGLPALIAAGFGLAMYRVGWWVLVGTRGEQPARHRRALLWYLVIGAAALALVAIFLVQGFSLLAPPPE